MEAHFYIYVQEKTIHEILQSLSKVIIVHIETESYCVPPKESFLT